MIKCCCWGDPRDLKQDLREHFNIQTTTHQPINLCSAAVMEKFQGPTNHSQLFYGEEGGEHLNVESSSNITLQQQGCEGGGNGLDFSYGSSSFLNTESFRFQQQQQQEEEQYHYHHHQQHSFMIPSLEEKMPFLQMLQSVESPPYSPFPEQTHFQVLLKYQQQPWVEERKYKYLSEAVDTRIQALELESCITHEISDVHSPIKSETTNKEQIFLHSTTTTTSSHLEVVSSFCNNQELNSPEKNNNNNNTSWVDEKSKTQVSKPSSSTNNQVVVRERKKRKRTRPSKNREEVETQRMTHIAVERNRRRQMNDHLSALRSLMPSSFIQRGDQASIIGGAIDFVKELEQLLQSLEAKKRMRDGFCEQQQEEGLKKKKKKRCDGDSLMAFNGFFSSPQYTSYSSMYLDNEDDDDEKEMDKKKYRRDDEEEEEKREEVEEEEEEMKKCVVADIEVIVIQTHVNLKILSPKRPGQLIRVIAALEELRLTILHLNITSLHNSVLYSFNLKIEDDCKVGTCDEIATVVHQIFSYINNTSTTTNNKQQQQLVMMD